MFTIDIKSQKLQLMNEIQSMIITNSNYLSYIFDSQVEIYNLSLNDNDFSLNYKTSIDCDNYVNYINFHPKYPKLILSSFKNSEIKLWQIPDENTECEEKCIFKGHSDSVQYAIFNPVDDNLVISSDNNYIKLWDITKYIHLNNFHQESIENLQWNTTGNYYGFINKNFEGLSIHEKKSSKTIFSIEEKIKKFYFISENELLTFNYNNTIKKWRINNNNPTDTITIETTFHPLIDNYFHYLYCLYKNRIMICGLNEFKIIEEKKVNDFIPFYPILLDNSFLKDKTIANILNIINYKCDIIKIEEKNEIINKKPQIEIKPFNDYIKNIIYKISDYSELFKYTENEKEEEDYSIIKSKNYLEFDEIKNELEKINQESIFQRKQIVEEKIKKEFNFKDIKEEYIFYLQLLIRDNTNKTLIKKYLNFLNKNQEQLKNSFNIETYEDEIQYYKVCFKKEELNEYFNEQKELSEKESVINFLSNLINIKNKMEFFEFKNNKIDGLKNISFFNQPIDTNNEELFFYKNKIALYYDILNNDYIKYFEKFQLKQQLIKQILDKKLLNNNIIITNEDRLNLLIYLIIYPEDDATNQYLLNLLNSNKCNDNDIKEITEKTNFKLITIDGKEYLKNNELEFDNFEFLCKDNFIINYNNNNNIIINKEELYSFEYLLNNSLSNDSLSKIKSFLKEILKSNVFEELFKLLYYDKYKDFFKDDDFVNEFIEKYFKFVPYKSSSKCGMTDRFSSKSYIFLEEKEISKNITKKEIQDILKTGRIIVITIHEINHNVYSYIRHFFNYLNLPFESPRKRKVYEVREGGFYIELILFGKIINEITLAEIYYILNLDNYKKSLTEFQKGFMNLKNENLKINGIFSEFNKIIDIENCGEMKNISIKTKNSKVQLKDIKITIPMRSNCVLGCHREINIESINDFFENYHQIE